MAVATRLVFKVGEEVRSQTSWAAIFGDLQVAAALVVTIQCHLGWFRSKLHDLASLAGACDRLAREGSGANHRPEDNEAVMILRPWVL